MSFIIEYTGGFNPFEWEALKCPVCRASEFISQDHAMVSCARCSAEFEVRMTAGDPGCVVDCFVKDIYAPLWKCSECGEEAAFFDWQTPACRHHHTKHTMTRVEGISKLWKPPKNYPRSYYLILKLGDYCSGWLGDNWVKDSSQKLGFPNQEEWDKFQQSQKIIWPRSGVRWAVV